MNKALIFSVVSALSASTLFASPAATQDWVRKYVSTNMPDTTGTKIEPTTVTVYNDEGAAEKVTFNWVRYTNEALRVYSTNVAGMTNGLTFAKTGDMRYYNATNLACALVTGSVEKVRMTFTGAVDRVVGGVTNTVYLGTNYVYGVVYGAVVNGVHYKSFEISPGNYYFQNAIPNDTSFFIVRSASISDAERRKVVTLPVLSGRRAFSIFDLLFPSVYAISSGEWIGPSDTREAPPKPRPIGTAYEIYGLYYRYYYTDAGDAKPFALVDIEWVDANGNRAVYNIDYEFFKIDAGTEVSSFSAQDTTVLSDLDTFKAKLQEILPRNRYAQLTRGNAFDAVLKRADELYDEYAKKCGEISKFADDIRIKTKSADFPDGCYPECEWKLIGTGVEECTKHIWRGTCGNWVCSLCGISGSGFVLPAEHTYNPQDGKCDKCRNSAMTGNVYSECGYVPMALSHHRGWHPDGVGTVIDGFCVCECGKYVMDHEDPGTANRYVANPSDGTCVRVWTCERCSNEVFNASDNDYVGKGYTATAAAHLDNGDGKYTSMKADGATPADPPEEGPICQWSYTCSHLNEKDAAKRAEGCGNGVVENLEHNPDGDKAKVEMIEDDYDYHRAVYPCSHGFEGWASNNLHWCGWTTNDSEVLHKWSAFKVQKVGDAGVYPPTAQKHYKYKVCGDWATGLTNSADTCGMHYVETNDHVMSITTYGNPQQHVHDVSNRCSICHFEKFDHTEAHATNGTAYAWKDVSSHNVSNVCYLCDRDGFWYFTRTEAHSTLMPSLTRFYGNPSAEGHDVSNICDRCTMPDGNPTKYYERTEAHSNDATYVVTRFRFGPSRAYYHDVSNKCLRCDIVYKDVEKECDKLGGWVLNQNSNGTDSATCSLCLQENGYAHAWVPDSAETHHCANGSGHFWMYKHTWDSADTNLCTLCGYDRTHGHVHTTRQTCADGCGCYRDMDANGLVVGSNCNKTDWKDGKCGCAECQGGRPNECECEYLNRIICVTDNVVTEGKYRNRWVNGPFTKLSGIDPVYHVMAYGFEGCCSNCLSLAEVDFSVTTNVGSGAFKHAFYGCTNLATVKFGALEHAGSRAFERAFGECYGLNGTALSFPNLKTAADDAFYCALASTNMPHALDVSNTCVSVSSFEFPKLVNWKAVKDIFGTYQVDEATTNVAHFNMASSTVAVHTVGSFWMKNAKVVRYDRANGLVDGYALFDTLAQSLEELHLDNSTKLWNGELYSDGYGLGVKWYTMVFVTNTLYDSYTDIKRNIYDARGDKFTYARRGGIDSSGASAWSTVVTCRCDKADLAVSDFRCIDVNNPGEAFAISEFSQIRSKWYRMTLSFPPSAMESMKMSHRDGGAWIDDKWILDE